jgi:PKD repeat protein
MTWPVLRAWLISDADAGQRSATRSGVMCGAARGPEALLLVGGLLTLAVACPAPAETPPIDAPVEPRRAADAAAQDGRPAVLAVEFTVTGCPNLDLTLGVCKGAAPLTLTFIPLGTSAVTRFVWDFGDGGKSFEETPTHTFTAPGAFDVALVGAGASGTSRKERKGFALVSANPAGTPCDLDGQCETGLRCICGAAARCPGPFLRGVCSRECGDGMCAAGLVCVDLSAPMGTAAREPWREPLCLKRCAQDRDCAQGHRCRVLPVRGEPWQRACFPEVPADLGASCRSPAGLLRPEQCVSGACADLGALGLCTLDCATASCPDGTACAELGDRRHVCLRPCAAGFACDADPLLACSAPGTPGPLGFTVKDAPAGTRYCGPRPCQGDSDCGPIGRCIEDGQGGTCTRRM